MPLQPPAHVLNTPRPWRAPAWALGLAALLGMLLTGRAFPPAPHHAIHGMVRDEIGDPISLTSAQVYLEISPGVQITCQVQSTAQAGENYRLIVPMDAGVAAEAQPYKATALRTAASFRLKVRIGNTSYVPIEMAGNVANLGKPGGETLLHLTLGVDSDRDGLPDVWERALTQILGGSFTLADITPQGDPYREGISNYERFLLGSSGLEHRQALSLALVRHGVKGPVIEFFATTGKSYTLLGTTNLIDWAPVTFRIPAGSDSAPPVQTFQPAADAITALEVILPNQAPTYMFYRMQVR